MNKDIIRLLTAAGFNAGSAKYLASGDDSDAFLLDKSYVVKIPKRESVKETQRREFMLYDFLQSAELPFEVPKTVYMSDKFNVMTYIDGDRMTSKEYEALSEAQKEQLAADEANFLKALHKIPVDLKNPLFDDVFEDKAEQLQEDKEELLRILGLLKLDSLNPLIDRIYDSLFSNKLLYDYTPCLIHNDFSASNMIFGNNRLKAVIDFGDYAIGDPDSEFRHLLDGDTCDFGKEFGQRVVKHYGADRNAVEQKARISDNYWPLEQVICGFRRNDRKMLDEGISKLFIMKAEIV